MSEWKGGRKMAGITCEVVLIDEYNQRYRVRRHVSLLPGGGVKFRRQEYRPIKAENGRRFFACVGDTIIAEMREEDYQRLLAKQLPDIRNIDFAEAARVASQIFVQKAKEAGREAIIPASGEVYSPNDVEYILEAVFRVAKERLGAGFKAGEEEAA